MESDRYPLLFNPNARGHKGRKALKFIMNNASRFVLYATRSEEEAVDFARKFAQQGEKLVIAAGGDGTLNAVIQGLKGTDTALGVFPSGTMNVFAREIGIPVPGFSTMPLDKALEVIDRGKVKQVDLFKVNERPFLQMAGIGFDAQIIEDTDPKFKKKFGPLSYLVSAAKVLRKDPPKLTLRLADGTTHHGAAILAGNGSLYGWQVKLFTKANHSDQLLDFLIFKENGFQMMMDALAGIQGRVEDDGNSIEYVQAASAEIQSDVEVPLQVDGDLAGRGTKFNFCMEPNRLKVIAPETPYSTVFGELIKKILPISQ